MPNSAQNASVNSFQPEVTSVSSHSSIEIWLDSHPEPTNYSSADAPLSPNPEKADGGIQRVHPRTRAHERQKLREISHNTMSKIPERQPHGSIVARQTGTNSLKDASPSKGLAMEAPTTPARHSRRARKPENEGETDLEATPLAKAPPVLLAPSLSSAAFEGRQADSPTRSSTSSGVQSRSTTSRETSKSGRSRSPTKRDRDIKLSSVRVEWTTWSAHKATTGPDYLDLYKSLKLIGNGISVIPDVVKTKTLQHMREVEYYEARDEDTCFAPTREFVEENAVRTLDRGLSFVEVFKEAVELYWMAKDCEKAGVSESNWNSAVHFPLLKLALRGYWRDRKGVWFYDLTSARIADPSLLPSSASEGKPMQSKMIDYAMVIEPSAGLKEAITDVLIGETGGYSINHTDAEYLRFSPITISMETKKPGMGQEEAKRQLEIWVAAHFARLRKLNTRGSRLPYLPLIMIQGSEWSFHIAEMVTNKNIEIYMGGRLGDTASILGVYQLLAGIRRLAKWVYEVYRVWFEREMLGIL